MDVGINVGISVLSYQDLDVKSICYFVIVAPLLAPKQKYAFDSALFYPEKVPPKTSVSNPSAAQRQTGA
jgi:hypothetical protein